MGDPELRGDESILLRTQGVFVKSIPFEGILTNKRIILIDRTTNILPQKEIPLVTLKDFQAGENAIRDQIITLFIVTREGETRQMILTFSRQMGGNRIKERDEWLKLLKENTRSSISQVIRKVIPVASSPPKKTSRAESPRIKVISSPVSHTKPAAKKPALENEGENIIPVKKIIKNSEDTSPQLSAAGESDFSFPGLGTYCSRCGNRVMEGSRFCNRCGTPIVIPDVIEPHSSQYSAVLKKDKAEKVPGKIKPILEENLTPPAHEPATFSFHTDNPSDQEIEDEPVETPEWEPATPLQKTIGHGSDGTIPKTELKHEPVSTVDIPSRNSESVIPDNESPALKKRQPGRTFKPGKKVVLGIIVIIIIIAVVLGGIFLYPMISKTGRNSFNSITAPTTAATTQKPGTFVIPTEIPDVIIPADGTYVHINYLGGWNGTYGMPSALQKVTNSGNRFYLVENATGTVQASFEKLDGSTKHDLVVEIFKNGKLLKSGNNSTAFGKVTLSVDTS